MPREIGKLTGEQLAVEREARAAREEIFRRICDAAEATGSTFEQAASRLGAPHHVVQYFQADYENTHAARLDDKSDNPISRRQRLSSFAIRFMEIVTSHWRAVLAFGALLVILGFGVLLVSLFRYEVKTTSSPGVVVRLDRLTGKMEWCAPYRGCITLNP